jgi:uncharacterized tellurite resistance protein B-like protein
VSGPHQWLIERIRGEAADLDQLVSAIRQLEPDARSELAKALMETELDGGIAELIESLASRPPSDQISDVEIVSEVNAVREQRRR